MSHAEIPTNGELVRVPPPSLPSNKVLYGQIAVAALATTVLVLSILSLLHGGGTTLSIGTGGAAVLLALGVATIAILSYRRWKSNHPTTTGRQFVVNSLVSFVAITVIAIAVLALIKGNTSFNPLGMGDKAAIVLTAVSGVTLIVLAIFAAQRKRHELVQPIDQDWEHVARSATGGGASHAHGAEAGAGTAGDDVAVGHAAGWSGADSGVGAHVLLPPGMNAPDHVPFTGAGFGAGVPSDPPYAMGQHGPVVYISGGVTYGLPPSSQLRVAAGGYQSPPGAYACSTAPAHPHGPGAAAAARPPLHPISAQPPAPFAAPPALEPTAAPSAGASSAGDGTDGTAAVPIHASDRRDGPNTESLGQPRAPAVGADGAGGSEPIDL